MKAFVYITPASKIGGEFPRPLRFRSLKRAQFYAQACRAIGQGARIATERQIVEWYARN